MWWATVEDRRKDEFGGSRGSAGDDDEDHHPDMIENDYARAFKGS